MITVSSSTKIVVDMLIHTAFFHIPVNFVFSLHIMLLAICTTQVKKESKKEILKKEKRYGYEK